MKSAENNSSLSRNFSNFTKRISSPKRCLCSDLYSNNLKKISQAYKRNNDETILNKKYLYMTNVNHLAEQICLLDSSLFLSIEWKELANSGWMKSKTKEIESPNVINMINQSNRLANVVISDIVYNEKLQSRLKALIFYISLSKKLLKLGNLNSSKMIISALLSQPIFRLTETWNHLKNKKKITFNLIKNFFDPTTNEYLDFIDQRLQEEKPLIPFLGIFLTRVASISSVEELSNDRNIPINFNNFNVHNKPKPINKFNSSQSVIRDMEFLDIESPLTRRHAIRYKKSPLNFPHNPHASILEEEIITKTESMSFIKQDSAPDNYNVLTSTDKITYTENDNFESIKLIESTSKFQSCIFNEVTRNSIQDCSCCHQPTTQNKFSKTGNEKCMHERAMRAEHFQTSYKPGRYINTLKEEFYEYKIFIQCYRFPICHALQNYIKDIIMIDEKTLYNQSVSCEK